ncbi:MAG: VWA domain-containing protein [Methanosarcinaceae archaeon]|nr:VWA domain-containing protein [Methanosarcinaceae archaeon]MDD4748918.1 VWA domain-containing protein [Methanosarcinaceae archaeon]
MPFETPLALLGLLSVIPLILLYLLRPKPLVFSIPSLMFVSKLEQEKKKLFTALTRLIKDPLFLVQLLILILLSIAAAGYFYTTEEPLSGEHIVLVLDSSASMQTEGRFKTAVDIAEDYVSKKNSIILASNVPLLALEADGASAAKNVLKELEAGAGVADLSAAISSGMRLLSREGGRIIVLSDFTNWKGDDPVASKKLAESYGIKLNFVKVGKPTDNVGIINGWIEASEGTYSYTCVVKNYRDREENVKIETLRGESISKTFSLKVPAGETNQFTLEPLNPGVTEIRLAKEDKFPVDNHAYISIPETLEQQILFITDDGKLPSKTALALLPQSELKVWKTLPADLTDYNLIVMAQKKTPLTAGATERLKAFVEAGGDVVFIGSEALLPEKTDVELVKLLPIKPSIVSEAEAGIGVEEIRASRITQDIKSEEVSVRKYLNATERTGATTLASLKNGVPILSYWQLGEGTILYLGLNDELEGGAWNNFHNLPEYPVFWIRLIEWIGGIGDISDYNLKTGTFTSLSKTEEIKTPTKIVTTDRMLYDEVGIYEVSGKKIAVNLYDDRESDMNVDATELIKRSLEEEELKTIRADSYPAKKDISNYLIGVVFLLMLLEILILRGRGEL